MHNERQDFVGGIVRRLFRREGVRRPPPDEPEGGAGVPVPAGPRPRVGGAAATLPPKAR